MSDEKKATHYELPTGAVAILNVILPTGGWYKDDPKPVKRMLAANAAEEALPAIPARPAAIDGDATFDAQLAAWGDPVLEFEWTDAQKDAVRVCVKSFIKNGGLLCNAYTIALINLLQIED